MSDKYRDSLDSTYCYANSNVLKNLLGITDTDTLSAAETEFSQRRMATYDYPSLREFSLQTWKNLHFYLFQDIYAWAGELRSVEMRKSTSYFARPEFIETEAAKIFLRLRNENFLVGLDRQTFVSKLALHYSDLNALHPFREGNGRSQRLLFEVIAINAGFVLDWSAIDTALWIPANIAAHNGKLDQLIALLQPVAIQLPAGS